MNKFKLYFVVISVVFVLFSCNKSDSSTVVPIRKYSVQYETDIATIEDYLKTYYIEEIVNHPGFSDDQDIKLTKIPKNGTQLSIWSLLDSPTYPMLVSKNVSRHDITYKVYYLKLRPGNDVGQSPTQVDEVLASYNGYYIKNNSTTTDGVAVTDIETTFFESLIYPNVRLKLDQTIRGWAEIFPEFKTGTYDATANPEEPAVYLNFGAGVMFVPSGLAYFNGSSGSIPAYSPLLFTFKLYDLKRADQDADGILSIDEDINHDGDFTNDDTDGDGKQNYLDTDDDGDGHLTKNEIKINGVFPASYDLILDCGGTTTGTKKHLDKNCY